MEDPIGNMEKRMIIRYIIPLLMVLCFFSGMSVGRSLAERSFAKNFTANLKTILPLKVVSVKVYVNDDLVPQSETFWNINFKEEKLK